MRPGQDRPSFIVDAKDVQAAGQRKASGEQTVLAEIESLLDSAVTSARFLHSARILRPSDYSEVVNERNCIGLCGYPVCQDKVARETSSLKFDPRRMKMRDSSGDQLFCSSTHRQSSFDSRKT